MTQPNPNIDPNAKCGVCRGNYSEHGNTIHAFTPLEGDLVTKEQAIKRVRDQQSRPAGGPGSPGPEEFKRLLHMLKSKGLLDDAETMYILLGTSPLVQAQNLTKNDPGNQLL